MVDLIKTCLYSFADEKTKPYRQYLANPTTKLLHDSLLYALVQYNIRLDHRLQVFRKSFF